MAHGKEAASCVGTSTSSKNQIAAEVWRPLVAINAIRLVLLPSVETDDDIEPVPMMVVLGSCLFVVCCCWEEVLFKHASCRRSPMTLGNSNFALHRSFQTFLLAADISRGSEPCEHHAYLLDHSDVSVARYISHRVHGKS